MNHQRKLTLFALGLISIMLLIALPLRRPRALLPVTVRKSCMARGKLSPRHPIKARSPP